MSCDGVVAVCIEKRTGRGPKPVIRVAAVEVMGNLSVGRFLGTALVGIR